jgi:RNA polymerase sigma-70 factor (ECF subfamily)
VRDQATGDAELVALARAGEAAALGVLLERHRVGLYATAMSLVHDREAALDAVQEACVTALTRLDSLDDPGAAGAWLRTVVRNHSLMHLRRRRREIPSDGMDLDAAVPGPEQAFAAHALRDDVWAALDAMAEEERLTLMLRHFSRCGSYRAIAEVTGVPVGTVRSRLNRARSRLVDALSAAGAAGRDQGRLEETRRRDWQSFYRDLHRAPTGTSTGATSRSVIRAAGGAASTTGRPRSARRSRPGCARRSSGSRPAGT